jgi:hypothetical protein
MNKKIIKINNKKKKKKLIVMSKIKNKNEIANNKLIY